MFFRGSRYEGVSTAALTTAEGRVIQYKRVRYIAPVPAVLAYRTRQGDRLDLVAYQFYHDPEQYWRICDANVAMQPAELTAEPDTLLAVPIPMG